MIPHRRREIRAGDQFTFYNPTQRASGDRKSSDGIEYGTWAERIKGDHGYFGKSDGRKFGAWQRRTQLNLHGDKENEDEFRWVAKEDGDDSDAASPPLWKNSGSPMARSAESSPIHHRFPYPTPQSQAIAGYRQEMLDMVRDMPETAYELSLRDLVESSPRRAKPVHETLAEVRELPKDKTEKEKDRKEKMKKGIRRMSRSESMETGELPEDKTEKEKDRKEKMKKGMRRMSRSESMETGGLLLKMFLPPFLTWRKKSFGGSGTCAKVSPKPMMIEGEKGGPEKSTDGDWWRKNSLGEKESSSSSSSNNSSRRRKMSGCYSFCRRNKNKGREN
uniref:Uncharacterized protein LOC105051766 n=1 Tax=Elaeis guineensis var. tenera TaxID=51953 RepID=A0A6I9RQ64_ELAGV|nr:uncharacterized protein LOC105051766 [Elaeis guineensis]